MLFCTCPVYRRENLSYTGLPGHVLFSGGVVEVTTIASAAASAVAGGGMSTWFIRMMVNRTLKGYDDAHKEHREKADAHDKEHAALMSKIAVLEIIAAEVKPLREENAMLRERMALAEAKLNAAWNLLERLKPMVGGCSGK